MKGPEAFALKGNIVYSTQYDKIEIAENSWLVCEDGKVTGIWPELPEKYQGIRAIDHGDKLLIPGLVDLHLHAPQFAFCGLGMDMELLDWLQTTTFPEESKYKDLEYAKRAYRIFSDSLHEGATTRACVFATIHREATLLLMDMLEARKVGAMVGKVNMDRNSPDILRETAEESVAETRAWLETVAEKKYQFVQPILTPRFIPSCTDELMRELKKIQEEYKLPVQSHLSENPGEVAWVQELVPESKFYGDAYDIFGMFGGSCPTVMAHCVYSDDREMERMKEKGVYIAHCPESNINLSSGAAPIRKFLENGLHVGLGSDVAAGSTDNMFKAMAYAVQASKMRWRMLDENIKPLTLSEVFYIATKGGGSFWGKVGSFEPGYEADILVIDDSRLECPNRLNILQRLERIVYLADDREVIGKYVAGYQVF